MFPASPRSLSTPSSLFLALPLRLPLHLPVDLHPCNSPPPNPTPSRPPSSPRRYTLLSLQLSTLYRRTCTDVHASLRRPRPVDQTHSLSLSLSSSLSLRLSSPSARFFLSVTSMHTRSNLRKEREGGEEKKERRVPREKVLRLSGEFRGISLNHMDWG